MARAREKEEKKTCVYLCNDAFVQKFLLCQENTHGDTRVQFCGCVCACVYVRIPKRIYINMCVL